MHTESYVLLKSEALEVVPGGLCTFQCTRGRVTCNGIIATEGELAIGRSYTFCSHSGQVELTYDPEQTSVYPASTPVWEKPLHKLQQKRSPHVLILSSPEAGGDAVAHALMCSPAVKGGHLYVGCGEAALWGMPHCSVMVRHAEGEERVYEPPHVLTPTHLNWEHRFGEGMQDCAARLLGSVPCFTAHFVLEGRELEPALEVAHMLRGEYKDLHVVLVGAAWAKGGLKEGGISPHIMRDIPPMNVQVGRDFYTGHAMLCSLAKAGELHSVNCEHKVRRRGGTDSRTAWIQQYSIVLLLYDGMVSGVGYGGGGGSGVHVVTGLAHEWVEEVEEVFITDIVLR